MSALDELMPRRVLLIKPSAIGDVVHTLPILNLLRKRWPDAHISWLLTPACAELLDGHPLLNEVILFERGRFGVKHVGLRPDRYAGRLFGLFSNLRGGNFDLVIDLQGLLRSGWLTWQTRAAVRVGFANARELAPIFYTHRVEVGSAEQHAVQRYLKVAAALGCDSGPVEFPFHVTAEDRAHAAALLEDDEPFAVLLPGTNWATKRWPVENYASLVRPLSERFGLKTLVAGSPSDAQLAQIIGGTDVTGKTTLRQLVALLERAQIVIANDSGPMHIAAALGRPLVTLFGPTNPIRTGPYLRDDTVTRIDIPCSPCYSRTCSHQSCLQWLKIEAVLEEVERQLGSLAAQEGT